VAGQRLCGAPRVDAEQVGLHAGGASGVDLDVKGAGEEEGALQAVGSHQRRQPGLGGRRARPQRCGGLARAPQPLLEHLVHGARGLVVEIERHAQRAGQAEQSGQQRRQGTAHRHSPFCQEMPIIGTSLS
jgi:hypothetical protein